MSEFNGKFIWYELMTSDTAAAEAFYRAVVGWGAQDSGLPGHGYTIWSVAGAGIGGLMALPAEACQAGAKPGWMGYIAVDDVDSYAERVKGAGGAIHRPPDDIPSVGRFSVVADPQGAAFVLFKPSSTEARNLPPPTTPGLPGWHELHAANQDKAFAFYAALFGWQKKEAIDMGPMGVYQLFATGGDAVGGMMTNTQVPAPFWLYYFIVDEIDAAAARVKDKGGQVANGPMQVPGGAWIIQCIDPQGAMFALVGPRTDTASTRSA